MEAVYGIHQGCIFEGGGTGRVLYKKKDDAISEAIKVFESKIARDEEYRKLDEEDEDFEVMSNHYEEFKWRKCDKQENRWHNTVDEIEVIEYAVK
jgi:hypothetical protein